MKRIILVCLLGCLIGTGNLRATQLSGLYSIDSAGTASVTVFKDVVSAVVYMTSTNSRPDGGPSNSGTLGVSGPVIFQIEQGTYVGQVDIPVITGASATNTITFDGGAGNATTRIISYTASSGTDAHTVRFNACSWVNFRNVTILAQGTSNGLAVHFYNANTNNSVRQCRIIASSTSSTTVKAINCTASNVVSTGSSCSGSAAAMTNIYIDSNYIYGGNIGIFMSSSTSSNGGPHNFYIRFNRIEGAYTTGIGASSSYGYLIEGNYIKMATGNTASKGIHHCNGSTTGVQSYIVRGNTIENAGQYGIHFQSNNANTAVAYPTQIVNNYIMPTFSNASSYGFDFSQGRNHKIYHNTILMNVAGGTGINLGTSANANCAVKNNIIQLLSPTATGVCINSGAANVDSCDYNVLTKGGAGASIVNLLGTTYTRSNFIGGGGFNLNSTMDDPMLNSVTDPRPKNICQKAPRIGWVGSDYNYFTRPNPAQIGCAEGVAGIANDAGVIALLEPASYPVVAGQQNAKVVIKNTGASTLTGVNVTVEVNSVQKTVAWTGSLNSCMTDTIVFSGANQIVLASGTNTLKAYTSLPNYAVDSNASNDTLFKTYCTPLATGTYTVGPGGVFTTLAEVAAALNCGGVQGVGPTTFQILSGTYNEQLPLGVIAGATESTPIIFRSFDNHPDSVTISFNATAAANYTIQLAGTRFVRFENLTLRSMSASAGIIMELGSTASYDTIINCKFIGTPVSSTGTALALVYASGVTSKRVAFINNTFSNGSYGIYFYGSSLTTPADSNLIEGNTFINAYYMTIALSNQSNVKVLRNTIAPGTYTSSYGIYLTTCANAIEVSRNLIRGQIGAYGIMLSSVNGTTALQGKVTNNVVSGGTTGSYYGIYMSSCTYILVSHNTVQANSTAATNYACWTQFTASTGTTVVIRNNVFCSNGAGTAATNAALYVYNKDYLNSNFNNLYCAGPTLVNVVTPAVTHPNLFSWRAASTYEKNSVSYKPGLISSALPFPNVNDSCSWSMNGHGTYLSYDTADYYGVARPRNVIQGAPDLGAVEFMPVSLPPLATTSPSALAPDSMQVFMFAGDTVARIKWSPYTGVPGYLNVRQFCGERPPHSDSSANNYMRVYTNFEVPFSYYSYDLTLYYKDGWRGTIPFESNLRMARFDSAQLYSNPWTIYGGTSSTVDTVANSITTASLSMFGYFTGTNDNNPLPVVLNSFNASRTGKDVLLYWSTQSEINGSFFEIQRSSDGRNFVAAGRVPSTGNSRIQRNYRYTDNDPWSGTANRTLFYRLKMVDADAAFEYSRAVKVEAGLYGENVVQVVPNPFLNTPELLVETSVAGDASISVIDLQGKTVFEGSIRLIEGANRVSPGNLDHLPSGVYLLELRSSDFTTSTRIIKTK